jgi:arylsulfatase
VQSRTSIPTDADVELKFVFTKTGENKGVGRLYVDRKRVGEGPIPRTVPGIYSATESFDTGVDTGTAAGDYELPFAFTGRLDSLDVTIDDAGPPGGGVPEQ